MSLLVGVVRHLPPSYSQAKSNHDRLSFTRPSFFAVGSFWSSFERRLAQLEQRASSPGALMACCVEANADNVLSRVRICQAYNRVVSAATSVDLEQPFPVVTLPAFWKSNLSTEYDFFDVVEGRQHYSSPIRVKSGGRVMFGYFMAYGKAGEPQLEEIAPAALLRMVEDSIKKNRSDANAIFQYTQKKRAVRWLRNSRTNSYFALEETEADKYDTANIQRGPLPCWGSAMLHVNPSEKDRFGAMSSGMVRVGAPSSSPTLPERPPLPEGIDNGVTITMLGHASMLIQFQLEGITVLTDPVFHDLNTVLYPRRTEPSCSLEDLPVVDVIVISHNHRDHVDEDALRFLAKQQPLIVVPLGDGPRMKRWGFLNVQEHSTWAETRIPFERPPFPPCGEHGSPADGTEGQSFSGHVGLVSVPANHWSCRSLNDANLSLFLGWVMYSSMGTGSVYFAGDTALLAEQDVRDIVSTAVLNEVYPPIMISLQPGGPNHERATMEGTHTSAADGVFHHFQHVLMATEEERGSACSFDDFLSLASSYLTMYMHHNVFELGIDRFNEALFVQKHLLNALAVLQGAEESTMPTFGVKERIPAFVHEVAAALLELLDSAGVEHRLADAESDHLSRFSALVEDRVISPKIGSSTFVPYPYA